MHGDPGCSSEGRRFSLTQGVPPVRWAQGARLGDYFTGNSKQTLALHRCCLTPMLPQKASSLAGTPTAGCFSLPCPG